MIEGCGRKKAVHLKAARKPRERERGARRRLSFLGHASRDLFPPNNSDFSAVHSPIDELIHSVLSEEGKSCTKLLMGVEPACAIILRSIFCPCLFGGLTT